MARPGEAWASLASYCGLDPSNIKPLEAHKKLVALKIFNFFLVFFVSEIDSLFKRKFRDSQRGAFLSRGVLRPAGKVDQAWQQDLDR